MVTKQQKIGIAVVVAGGLAIYFATRTPTTYHYITLSNPINYSVPYDGATMSAAQAVSTIEGDVMIWWQDAAGKWLFYDTSFLPGSTLDYIENGQIYTITLTISPQDWKVPDAKGV